MADGVEESANGQFLLYHEGQLAASEIPRRYWRTLYTKIQSEVRKVSFSSAVTRDDIRLVCGVDIVWPLLYNTDLIHNSQLLGVGKSTVKLLALE